MPVKRLLAKGLYRLAEGTLKEFRNEHAMRSDLGPVIARLNEIERRQTPRWIAYATLSLVFLTFLLAIWILTRAY